MKKDFSALVGKERDVVSSLSDPTRDGNKAPAGSCPFLDWLGGVSSIIGSFNLTQLSKRYLVNPCFV